MEEDLVLPPNLVAAQIRGREVQGRAAVMTALLELPPDERANAILILEDGFRAPLGKFSGGDDEV